MLDPLDEQRGQAARERVGAEQVLGHVAVRIVVGEEAILGAHRLFGRHALMKLQLRAVFDHDVAELERLPHVR